MIARLIALFFVLCFTTAAQAQVIWSTPGSGCVPDESATKFERHKVGNASVEHATGNVDLIVLTCPIPRFDGSGKTNWGIAITYQDSTGNTAAQAFVQARLYRMKLGAASPLLLATVSSNSSPATTLNEVSTTFTHTFNFAQNTYWVHVELQRSLANQIVIFHSVFLGSFVPLSDVRAKHDIVLLGHLDNGLGFYRFSYHGSDAAYVGVMAQEVEAIMPNAVVRGDDGYLRVYYDRLGLRMQTWEDWVAAGEKIPATPASMRQ
jgi:hypothetical protein